jgi:chemotaxis protein MotB
MFAAGPFAEGDSTMLRGKMSLWIVVSAMAALSAAGCCQEQDKQIASLRQSNKDLTDQNVQLRSQITAVQQSDADVARNLDAKDALIANKDAEIAGLRAKLNQPGGRVGTGAQGWEQGTFGDRIVVGSDLLFKPGDATLTAAGKTKLDKIAQDIKVHYAGLVVRVYGHTDSDPIVKSQNKWDDNLELSANRAMEVTRYLISKGVSGALVESIGMGDRHPEVKGNTAADKAKNRRVEIYVVKAK